MKRHMRGALKVAIGALVGLILLVGMTLAGFGLWLESASGHAFVRSRIQTFLDRNVHGTVEIGGTSGSLLKGMSFERVVARGLDGSPIFSAASIDVRYSPLMLLSRTPILHQLSAHELQVFITEDQRGVTNLERFAVGEAPKTRGATRPPKLWIGRVRIDRGALVVWPRRASAPAAAIRADKLFLDGGLRLGGASRVSVRSLEARVRVGDRERNVRLRGSVAWGKDRIKASLAELRITPAQAKEAAASGVAASANPAGTISLSGRCEGGLRDLDTRLQGQLTDAGGERGSRPHVWSGSLSAHLDLSGPVRMARSLLITVDDSSLGGSARITLAEVPRIDVVADRLTVTPPLSRRLPIGVKPTVPITGAGTIALIESSDRTHRMHLALSLVPGSGRVELTTDVTFAARDLVDLRARATDVELSSLFPEATGVRVAGNFQMRVVAKDGLWGAASASGASGDLRGLPIRDATVSGRFAGRTLHLLRYAFGVPGARVEGVGEANFRGGVSLAFRARVVDAQQLKQNAPLWRSLVLDLATPFTWPLEHVDIIAGTYLRAPDQPGHLTLRPSIPGEHLLEQPVKDLYKSFKGLFHF